MRVCAGCCGATRPSAICGIAYFSTQRIAPVTNEPNGSAGRGRSRSARVSANFFDILGVAPLAGRLLSIDDEHERAPVVVITYSWYEIVGVVGDTRRGGLERAVIPEFYGPLTPSPGGRADLVVRTTGNPMALADAVRAQVERAMPQARIASVTTAEAQLAAFSAQRRLQTWLLTAFAVVAVLLAGVGIFGLAHYAAAERTQEIGIRIALGASPGNVLRLLLADGLRMPLLGIGAGLAAAAGLRRFIASQLYDVTAGDPATFVSVALVLAAVAASACVLAAWRVSHANPVRALRNPTA